ncbi:hypothetical protein NAV31_16075 [Pseudomonas stutzeri]|nr:hypothetical protein [Stutzerimonas degradans]
MDRHRPSATSEASPPPRRSRANALVSLGYVLGLLLVFAFSLYLLPAHTGVGKLLWGN